MLAFPEVKGMIDSPVIEILSPPDGSTFDGADSEEMTFHIRITGMVIPDDGYADILLDGQLLGSTPQNEVIYMLDASSNIPEGDHSVTVTLYDAKDDPIGVEDQSLFRYVGKGAKRDTVPGEAIRDDDTSQADAVREDADRSPQPDPRPRAADRAASGRASIAYLPRLR